MIETIGDDYGEGGMSKSKFNLAFYGPSIREGSIDVRDYAPALLALADLVQTVNEIENEGRVRARVTICATREGCFDVQVEVVQTLLDLAHDIVRAAKGEPVATSAVGVLMLLFGQKGVFALYKHLRGESPKSVREQENGFEVTARDNNIFHVTHNTYKIYGSPKATEHAKKFTAVLKRGGAEQVVARLPSKDECGISYDDPPIAEEALASSAPLAESKRNVWLDIVTAGLERGAKWRVWDGNNEFAVTVTDEAFLDGVDNNVERFGHGDRLFCVLHEKQEQTRSGQLRTTRTVTKVMDHTESQQGDLFS